jgi:hypothetical protein
MIRKELASVSEVAVAIMGDLKGEKKKVKRKGRDLKGLCGLCMFGRIDACVMTVA